jgi:hypothetical protein
VDERKSDTQETFGEQELPGELSDQNAEESSHPSPGADSSGSAGPSGRGEDPDRESAQRSGNAQSGGGGDGTSAGEGRPGGAGEGSQATGNRNAAG